MRIHCPSLTIPSGKIYSYPTRLVEAYQPRIMEFYLPGDFKQEHEIEVISRKDSTNLLGIKSRNPLKAFYQLNSSSIEIEDRNIYDSRYETDGNIAHILTNVIPRILVCQKFFSNITVVLRANATTMAQDIYKALGISAIYTNKAVYGNLLLPSSPKWEGSYEPLYSDLFKDLAFAGYDDQTPERIFIARKGKRRLCNEDEVAGMLHNYGFQKVYFEDISIAQQWSLCRNAKVIVGMHGAALANLLFNRGEYKLVELFHPGYIVNMYRNLAYTKSGKWVGVAGQITQDVIKKLDFEQIPRAFALTSTKIDLNSLEMALNYLNIDKV